jgi:c-di-AMP phosphodiesterase-like protein
MNKFKNTFFFSAIIPLVALTSTYLVIHNFFSQFNQTDIYLLSVLIGLVFFMVIFFLSYFFVNQQKEFENKFNIEKVKPILLIPILNNGSFFNFYTYRFSFLPI